MSPKEIGKNAGISPISVRRMIKKRRLNQFKRSKATMISLDTQKRQTIRKEALSVRFSRGRSIEKYVWQDEIDFTLDVLLNSQNSRV